MKQLPDDKPKRQKSVIKFKFHESGQGQGDMDEGKCTSVSHFSFSNEALGYK